MKPPRKIVIIAPTCFYYQVSLFREIAADPRFDLIVYFCSDEALRAHDAHVMYETDEKWGDEAELLDGFKYEFMLNFSPRASYLKWPFGLMNFGVWNKIGRQKPDAVIIMSWMNLTWWIAILACLRHKAQLFYLTDANIQGESTIPGWKRWIKKLVLGKTLFPKVTGFLCAGFENETLYRSFGVPNDRLIPYAYSWGYDNLLKLSQEALANRGKLRETLGISQYNRVILFCGRLSAEKNPFHLLQAYQKIANENTSLLFVGDGYLRSSLEEYVAEQGLKSVYFVGFQRRTTMPDYYAISDLLVLPSRRETWGMVVNEAMCFGLPIIVSNQVGAGSDLVKDGYNGFKFQAGDITQLAQHIATVVNQSKEEQALMKSHSVDLITKWTDRDLCGSLHKYLDNLESKKTSKKKLPTR